MALEAVLEHVGRKAVCVVGLQDVGGRILDFLHELTGRPEPWQFRFFADGPELVDYVSRASPGAYLLGVLPRDEHLHVSELAAYATSRRAKVIVVVVIVRQRIVDKFREYYV